MEHMQKTVNVWFEQHAAILGLAGVEQLRFGPYPEVASLPDLAVAVFALRTLPDSYTFSESSKEKYLTVLQVDILTRSADDFAPVRIRDKLFTLLDGRRQPRQNWTDPDHPVEAGEIRWRYQDEEPFDLAGGVRAISMTYELQWWKPPKE